MLEWHILFVIHRFILRLLSFFFGTMPDYRTGLVTNHFVHIITAVSPVKPFHVAGILSEIIQLSFGFIFQFQNLIEKFKLQLSVLSM